MPMRQDCKQFESRTYPNGDTVRKCNLNLAPEAPWRCPETCDSYEKRLADVSWSHGTLVTPPAPPEPESLSEDAAAVTGVLDSAADIVNSVGADVLAEVKAEQKAARAAEAAKNATLGAKIKKLFRRGR